MKGKSVLVSVILGLLILISITEVQALESNPLDTVYKDIAIVKVGVTIKILENTDFCEKECYTKYQICFGDTLKQMSDLQFFFKKAHTNKTYTGEQAFSKLPVITSISNKGCFETTISGTKGKFESIDNILCLGETCWYDFAWWNSSFGFRIKIEKDNITASDFFFSVNDTNGINGTIMWTKLVSEDMFVYCMVSDCATEELAIGNETDQLAWLNESTLQGNDQFSVADNNVMMWWAFGDNSSNNMRDYSGNNNNGSTIVGAVLNTSGIYGNAMRFDGSDMIIGDDPITEDRDFTAMAWIRLDSHSDQSIFWTFNSDNEQEDFALKLNAGSTLTAFKRTDNSTSDADDVTSVNGLNIGQWYLATFVYDQSVGQTGGAYNQGAMNLYINGTLEDDVAVDSNVNGEPIGNTLQLGGINHSLIGWNVTGLIDDARIYFRALNQSEIQEIYWAGINNLSFTGELEEFENDTYTFRVFDEETEERLTFNATFNNGTTTVDFNNVESIEETWDDFPFGTNTISFVNESGGYVQRNRVVEIVNLTALGTSLVVDVLLLKTASASLINFVVIDSFGVQIEGALVVAETLFQDNFVVATSGLTDSSGSIGLFLNQLTSYRITVTASGFTPTVQTITPTNPPFVIRMTRAGIGTRQTDFSWITYSIQPFRALVADRNETIFFNIYSDQGDLIIFGMNITFNGSVVFSENITTLVSGGVINGTVNLTGASNYDQVQVDAFFQRFNLSTIPITKNYTVFVDQSGNFSLVNLPPIADSELNIFQKSFVAILITFIVIMALAGLGFRDQYGLGIVGLGVLSMFTTFTWFDFNLLIMTGITIAGLWVWRR